MSREVEEYVTPEYLLSHGFVQYKSIKEGDIWEIPFGETDALYFREINFDRNIFVVSFSPYNGDPKEGYGCSVYVQEDAGCGFVCIPERWRELPIEYFESIYYGIRGEKPKFNPQGFTNAEFEIIQPKQLNDKP